MDFSFNTITSLAEGMGKLGRLQTLNMSNDGIKGLPSSLGNLGSLLQLNLSYNQIEKVDPIVNIPKIQILNLSHNIISTFPPNTALRQKTLQLTDLDLSYNNLKEDVRTSLAIGSLTHLNVARNYIGTLSDAL